ncbi:hypothetical protein ACES2J_08645 [Bdellovibrio bacteriovorus]|uniref:hypothetical protein n=1 Tax=Bdellovibrio bacteriovorus TaxID=959 RepID=UPI0035A67945
MSKFRLALGSASCRDNKSKDPQVQEVCRILLEKLEALKSSDPIFLKSFPLDHSEIMEINGREVLMTVFHDRLPKEESLLVIQAYYSTWKFPNFISLGGVGKVFAEGFLLNKTGEVKEAPESLLWDYR